MFYAEKNLGFERLELMKDMEKDKIASYEWFCEGARQVYPMNDVKAPLPLRIIDKMWDSIPEEQSRSKKKYLRDIKYSVYQKIVKVIRKKQLIGRGNIRKKKQSRKKKRNGGNCFLYWDYIISPELRDVCWGISQCSRSQATKHVWTYIKANGLQDPLKKREINCDEKLRKLFNNKKRITMFEIAKYMGRHLLGNPIKSTHAKNKVDTKSLERNSANGNTWCRARREWNRKWYGYR